jgi:NADPH:quinone reductase-like Zn-dependent oxidoreductase
MPTMKAVRIHHYGGPETLKYEDALRPTPADGEVLVRVVAAGVNALDWKVRAGHVQRTVPHALPLILGWDLSGTIETVGPGVTGFAAGDDVYAHPDFTANGAYAEFISVRASELAKKPRSLDHTQAASVPLAALTAWQTLCDKWGADVVAGQTVLVHGGAGGVGHFAVQFAKWRGAKVIATGSAANERFVRDLGADDFIDYTRHRFEDVVFDVDAVVDTVGMDTQMRSWKVIKPGGVLAGLVSPPSQAAAKAHRVRGVLISVRPNAVQLAGIAELIDSGTIKPTVAEVLPLSQARKAHEVSQGGHVRGKMVLRVAW